MDNPSNSNTETVAAHYHTGMWNLILFFSPVCVRTAKCLIFYFPHPEGSPEVLALPVISIEVQFFCQAPVEFANVKLSIAN